MGPNLRCCESQISLQDGLASSQAPAVPIAVKPETPRGPADADDDIFGDAGRDFQVEAAKHTANSGEALWGSLHVPQQQLSRVANIFTTI